MSMKVSNKSRASFRGLAAAWAILIAAGTGLAAGGLAPGASASAPGSATAASQQTITLVNGDRVVVTRSAPGMQEDAVLPVRNGVNQALLRLDLAGQAYEIPADAVPYLGRGLSPRLFEVNSLLAAESSGRLPVQVNYQGQLPRLPGVTITGSGSGAARGYLTASSSAVFGAALGRQMVSDHARGSYGNDGMFAGGVSISLPGQAAAAPARPDFPMHTLTVTGTDLSGGPDTGDAIEVLNVDSLTRFGLSLQASFSSFYHGVAKYSVPAGQYAAFGFFDVMSGTTITGYRTVALPQFTVAGNTTVAMAESAASHQVQIVTPRPAVTQDTMLGIRRGLGDGSAVIVNFAPRTLPQWVNETTQPVTTGTLRTIATARLTSPASAGQPYEYDLAFAGPNGRIGSQRYVVTAGNVATVHANFYQDVPVTVGWEPGSAFGFESTDGTLLAFAGSYPFTLPQSETQYTSAGPSLFWQDVYWLPDQDWGQIDRMRTFTPGQSVTMDWNAYPLHPTPAVNLLGTANPVPVMPTASRAGNTLTLDVVPFGDNTPGHTGSGFLGQSPGNVSGSYELDQNGAKIASGNVTVGPYNLFLQADLSSRPATDKFMLDATRTGSLFTLSTSSRTIWTWRSAPESDALPAGWVCPAGNQACAVQPMMTLLYQVAGMGLDGSAPAGEQRIVLTAGHLQLAPPAKVTAMSVAVSVNGGRTWQPASVTRLGGGRFAAAFTAPSGASVSLRVQATDATGDSIAETIIRGYHTAP